MKDLLLFVAGIFTANCILQPKPKKRKQNATDEIPLAPALIVLAILSPLICLAMWACTRW